MNKITLKINGMMCGMCEAHVNDVIRKNFKIKKVESSHVNGETIILTQEDITDVQFHEVLDPTGYIIEGIERKVVKKHGLFWK